MPDYGRKLFCYHQLAVRELSAAESLGAPPAVDLLVHRRKRGKHKKRQHREFLGKDYKN